VGKAAAAIKTVYPDAEVYVFGGAAEGRLTVLSDVDVAVVFDRIPGKRAGVLARIWEAVHLIRSFILSKCIVLCLLRVGSSRSPSGKPREPLGGGAPLAHPRGTAGFASPGDLYAYGA
jgi:hypothetical protein